MNAFRARSKALHVIVSVAVVLVLGGLLAGRIMGSNGSEVGPLARADLVTRTAPAPALVAEPLDAAIDTLDFPRWAEAAATQWPVRFRTNLDILAPLGDGNGNAADFFKAFSKPDGPRLEEARQAMERSHEHPIMKKVLAFDEPLLAEAEPWCDQASMRFYDDVFPLEGYATRIANLLVPLWVARTWVARGLASDDPVAALEDCRRAIRLGRLLRQEDVVVISDLVGLACIRYGAEGIYAIAQRTGDADLAVKAAVVLSEVAPQRLLTSERLTDVRLEDFAVRESFGRVKLVLPEARLEALIRRSQKDPDRRFRCEAALALNLVYYLGPEDHRERAGAALNEMLASGDPILEQTARWSLDTEPSDEYIKESLAPADQ